MTKIKTLTMLLVICMIYSCDTPDMTEKNLETQSLSEDIIGTKNLNTNTREDDEFSLQNTMQWVSYMTVQVLLNNRNARTQFQNQIDNSDGTNVFPLENLIGWDVPNGRAFKSAFKNEFLLNYHGIHPCDNRGRPRGRITPPPIGGYPEDSDYDAILFSSFLGRLLDEHCLEFYAPNSFANLQGIGINVTGHPIKSTAHPLNNDNSNTGYYHHANSCLVDEISLNNNEQGFIILVRPKVISGVCSYSEYPVSDFTDFMD